MIDEVRPNTKILIPNAVFWEATPGAIFQSGISYDDKDGVNFHLTGNKVKWVAVKGGNDDWAIYFGACADFMEEIKRHGYKVSAENVSNLVEVSDEVLKRYRK